MQTNKDFLDGLVALRIIKAYYYNECDDLWRVRPNESMWVVDLDEDQMRFFTHLYGKLGVPHA